MTRANDTSISKDREIAMLADQVAFYAYQAKYYCALADNGNTRPPNEKEMNEAAKTIEANRIAENKERGGVEQNGSDTFL